MAAAAPAWAAATAPLSDNALAPADAEGNPRPGPVPSMDAASPAHSQEPRREESPEEAPTPEPVADEAVPGTELDPTAELNRDYGWPAGTLREQLDRDPTLVPYGKGALFVPSMVNSIDEPPVTVWQGNKKLVETTTGVRIVLAPGDYFVQMGSGNVEQRFGRTITVHEQKTSVLPVTWAGLSVHVIDGQLNALRLPYEILRMEETSMEYMGAGYGADERAGEPIFSWLLQPGLYKIVRLGTSYVSRVDFCTVRLAPGQHTHFLLVLDPDTGAFMGAGEARREDLFKPSSRGIWSSLIFGGDVTATQRQGAVDVPNGDGWGFHAFLDSKLNVMLFENPLLLHLQVQQGQIKLPQYAWQKQSDRLQLDLLYIYKLKPAAGPYIRASGFVNAFASVEYFPTPYTVQYTDLVTKQVYETKNGVQFVKVAPPFGNMNIREGAGFNLRVFKNFYGETTVRSGLGLRHIINQPGVLQDVSDATKPYKSFYRLRDSVNQVGIEATAIAVGRITRWVLINVVADSLVPFNGINLLDLDIYGTLSIKLTQYISLNYVIRYTQMPEVYPEPIAEQDWFLRFSLELI